MLQGRASTLNASVISYKLSGAGEPVAAEEFIIGVTFEFVLAAPEDAGQGNSSVTMSSRTSAENAKPLGANHSEPALQFRLSCRPTLLSVASVVAIDVTSDSVWTASTPAGTSIVDETYVLPSTDVSGDSSTPFSIDNAFSGSVYIREVDLIPLEDYVDKVGVAPLTLAIRLRQPDATREHRFTVTYSMANGDTFTSTSEPVTVSRDRTLPENVTDWAWQLVRYSHNGSIIEPPISVDHNKSGFWLTSLGSRQLMFAQIPGRESCEYNVDIQESQLVFLNSERAEPGGPTNRYCSDLQEPSTPMQHFFERFFDGTLAYRLDGIVLTLESATGDVMYLEPLF